MNSVYYYEKYVLKLSCLEVEPSHSSAKHLCKQIINVHVGTTTPTLYVLQVLFKIESDNIRFNSTLGKGKKNSAVTVIQFRIKI